MKSRPQRWADALTRAQDAISELEEIQSEYQEWRDSLPENLESSVLAEKLDAVCELEIGEAKCAVDECEIADLPLGFGRD